LVEAREKARARTAERRRREQRLEDLATDWFQTEGEISEIEAAAQRKIDVYSAKVRGEAEKGVEQLRDRMTVVVGEMLKLAGVRAVAELLGVPESTVRTVKLSTGESRGSAIQASPPATAQVPQPADEPTLEVARHGVTSTVSA
jgi:hypothetical protein